MKQRLFTTLILIFLAIPFLAQKPLRTFLFVGTYTNGRADTGIFIYTFDPSSGKLQRTGTGEQLTNPSFLCISPNGKNLFACTNSKLPEHGKIAAFRIDSISGKIEFINSQSSEGENPVYVSVDKTNHFVANGNYTEGNASFYKIDVNGILEHSRQVVAFKDSSVNRFRQEKAHVHAAVFSPDNRFLFFPDLGSDKIRVFAFYPDSASAFEYRKDLEVKTVPGSGPRHLTFHPNRQFAYCIEELSGTISAYNCKEGKLNSIQRVFSYAKKQEEYSGADIHVSPDGLFLYASNRGENTLSIFSVNMQNGKLTLLGHQSTFGDHPRNFTIDPSGNFLLVANVATNNIVVFKRDVKTGKLIKTDISISVPSPSCLQMRSYMN